MDFPCGVYGFQITTMRFFPKDSPPGAEHGWESWFFGRRPGWRIQRPCNLNAAPIGGIYIKI